MGVGSGGRLNPKGSTLQNESLASVRSQQIQTVTIAINVGKMMAIPSGHKSCLFIRTFLDLPTQINARDPISNGHPRSQTFNGNTEHSAAGCDTPLPCTGALSTRMAPRKLLYANDSSRPASIGNHCELPTAHAFLRSQFRTRFMQQMKHLRHRNTSPSKKPPNSVCF